MSELYGRDETGREFKFWTTLNFDPTQYFKLSNDNKVTGRTRFAQNALFSTFSSTGQTNAIINVGIGMYNTGFHSPRANEVWYYLNGSALYNMSTVWRQNNFDPGSKINVTGCSNITGELILTTDNYIGFRRNSDFFYLGFKNTSDGDTDSYGYLKTGDNNNEYLKFIVGNKTVANFKYDTIELYGTIKVNGNLYINSGALYINNNKLEVV